ncbi:HD domain-containing protein [Solirubrobacter ginsenosidimutans]|uniref:HD domain-containing protein n=1 Tax=Solirubrobacter ginsenosidimutans TaxID=490573 RepID=A0A9X3S3U5_9ACTN|nr:HD domain-containing protein [Solirubrobacter ginsenosidimutans]MDA0159943.1 HD domain-containing protein [Solirubrobacter ginsenosidimutans]
MADATTIAGIRVPDSALAREATEFVRDVSTQLLYDHSRRVFLWGSLLGRRRGLEFDAELLYVGAMFHDIGLLDGHRSTHQRFELDGADAARAFLERHGVPEPEITLVWDAIALHTTPEIPHRKRAEVALVTTGVECDVLGLHADELAPEQRSEIIAAHPRTGFKSGIVDAFFDGMRDRPDTTFGTMNTDILEGRLAGYVRPNFCQLIAANPLGG